MKQVITVITDDLTGKEGAAELSFGLDGADYTVDLTEANARKLRKALTPYLQAARKVKPEPARSKSTPRDRARLRVEIRTWARKNGWPDIADRGRVPEPVYDAYFAAARGFRI